MFRMHIALQHLRSSPNAEVLWIDTVGSFSWKRLSQLVCGEQDKEDKQEEVDSFLDSFIVWHFSSGDIMEFVNMVKEWITTRHDGENGELREERAKRMVLVVVDCVSNLFRPHRHPVLQERIESIRKVGLILRNLALKMDCPIVCVNQMSTKIGNYADVADNVRCPAQLQPALGTNWSVMMDLSLELKVVNCSIDRDSGSDGDVERTISIIKSDYTYKNNIINNMPNDHLPKEESFSIAYHKVIISK